MDFDDSELLARKAVRGRGTGAVPVGRFERQGAVFVQEEEAMQTRTELFRDSSRSILSFNDSPDVGFSASLNPYRGCEHGCIYCYARPTHEYLGLSAGLDFETKIFVKYDAPELLRAELMKKSWKPTTINMSGVTDCYQPSERKLEITRRCLQVLAEFRNPVFIITKNYLITRDIDVLAELAKYDCVQVLVSITTLDKELARRMEPRTSAPHMRLKTVEELSKAGIQVHVNMAPLIPGLTDHEIPTLLKAAADAGALSASYIMLRLPYGVKELFPAWLEENYPLKKQKVLNHIREVRGGKLNNADFSRRMSGEGVYAENIEKMFATFRDKYGLNKSGRGLSTAHFRRAPEGQLSLL